MLPKYETINQRKKDPSVDKVFLLLLVFINAIVLKAGFVFNSQWYFALLITLPLLLTAILSTIQKSGPPLDHPRVTKRQLRKRIL